MCIFLRLIIALITIPTQLQIHSLYAEDVEDGKLSADEKAAKNFRGFGTHNRLIVELCKAIKEDGRNVELFNVSKNFLDKEQECTGCYYLYKVINSSCKPPKIKITKPKKGVVATPTPMPTKIPKQLDPNTKVLYFAETMADQILHDNKRKTFGEQALMHLRDIFMHWDWKSEAEVHYFSRVAEALRSPLEEAIKVREEEEKAQAKEELGDVDELLE